MLHNRLLIIYRMPACTIGIYVLIIAWTFLLFVLCCSLSIYEHIGNNMEWNRMSLF